MENGCPFCDVVNNASERIIRSSKFCVVILSNPKLMEGHMLVVPKRHVERPVELSAEERSDFFGEVIKLQEDVLSKIAPGCDISQHYRPFIPNNSLRVGHLHFHIRPRFLDDELYEKVQKFENDVFKNISDEETDKYVKIFGL